LANPAILELVGKGGSKLNLGGVIISEDAQLQDAEKQLEYSPVLVVPPLSEPSAEQKAITVVKNAGLTVDG
jgi:hypothetical protein